MILAIDFDGTIVEHKYPGIGDLLPFAKEVISRLYSLGHYIIIWTCRTTAFDASLAQMFLTQAGIPYHTFNKNSHECDVQSYPKVYADIYIDDRQIGGLPTWPEIYKIITGEEFHA